MKGSGFKPKKFGGKKFNPRFRGAKNIPVKVGDEKVVKILSVGSKGDGIAKVDGYVLFVKDGKEGEEVKVKITKTLNNFGFAEKV